MDVLEIAAAQLGPVDEVDDQALVTRAVEQRAPGRLAVARPRKATAVSDHHALHAVVELLARLEAGELGDPLPVLAYVAGQDVWLPDGESFTSADGAGAACWVAPGRWHLEPRRQLGLLPSLVRIAGPRTPRFLRLMALIEKKHPAEREGEPSGVGS